MTLSADLTQLAISEEVTFATIPTNPVWKILPFSGESLLYAPASTRSRNISGSRQTLDSALVSAGVSGDVTMDLAYEDSIQDLMSATLGGIWNANIAKVGTTRRSFSIERKVEAGVTDQYQIYKGMVPNGFQLNASVGNPVTIRFDFVGCDVVTATAAQSGAVYTAIAGNPVFTAPQVASILIGGVSQSTKIVGSIALNVRAGARGIEGLGTLGYRDVNLGTFEADLTYDVYFQDASELALLKAQTATDITFTLTDSAGKDLIFLLGTVKLSDVRLNAGGRDTDMVQTVTMTGLYDTSDASTIVITRSPT